MMTYGKIVFMRILQLAFAGGAGICILSSADVRLSALCVIATGLVHLRFLRWWNMRIDKLLQMTAFIGPYKKLGNEPQEIAETATDTNIRSVQQEKATANTVRNTNEPVLGGFPGV